MKSRLLVSTAAALIAGLSFAYAQGTGGGGQGSGTGSASPSAQGGAAGGGTGGGASSMPSREGGAAQQGTGSQRPSEPSGQPGQAQGPRSGDQGQAQRSRDQAPAQAQGGGSGQPGQAQQSGRGGATTGAAPSGGNVTSEQRTQIRQRLGGVSSARVTNVNFSLSVGVAVPATVRVHPLPPEIVEIVPAYRGYDYVIVEDEIVIIEPRTRKIVLIIT